MISLKVNNNDKAIVMFLEKLNQPIVILKVK